MAHSPLAGLSAPAGVRARAPCLARWIRSAHGNRLGQHHGHEPPAPAALQLVELRARGALRLGLADAPEALLELRVAEVAAHLRLVDQPIDVVAHLLQGADVGVRGEAVQRRLEAEAGLRARQAGEHAHPLLAQPGDLALEGDQVLLGAFGLLGELGQLGRETRHLRPERVAAPDQVEGHGIVVALDGDLELAAYARQLGRLALVLLRELAAQVDDAGRGLAQLRILRHALPDGGDVDRVGVALLAAADPARGEAAQEVPDSSDEVHGLSLHSGSLTASSAVRPSSRIFCCRFWRCMPTSSAALVMLPPWRRSAWRRNSRSKFSTMRSLASRKVAGSGSGAGVCGMAGRPKRSAAVISGPGASSSACSTAERSSRTLPRHSCPTQARSASPVSGFGSRPKRAAASLRKWSIRRGMSSRRSASGGMASSTTRRR